MSLANRGERQAGQVLAIFTFGFLAIVAGVAFVVDGGNAFANQRISQNGTDAAAQAGATVLAERLGGAQVTDQDVKAAVDGILTEMEMDAAASVAVYTDIDGSPIGTTVGVLSVNSAPPPAASGVAVTGERPFGTFFARALGMDQFIATTNATAITGYGEPDGSTVLPVTPPVTIVTCDGQNNPVPTSIKWGTEVVHKVPLCKNGPGNVGWLDWTPPSGGTSELVDQILNPMLPPPGIVLPSWNFVTETGNMNSKPIEDALRTYDGEIVLIPLFDSTCNTQPTGNLVTGCPPANVGGNGVNQWYHFPEVAAFHLCTQGNDADGDPLVHADCTPHGSYVNGNNQTECDTGNGATSCLIGKFVNFITSGTVTGPLDTTQGPSDFVVVQLIK